VTFLLAVAIGVLYATGTYLLLRRSAVRVVFGLALLGYAANLLIFTAGRLVREVPPIVPAGALAPPDPSADPLPQALILTAIVIGFGVQAFALVLLKRTCHEAGTDDVDAMREEDA
jgi:multicomponent Na+:H+ antiporter subunit C